MVYACYKLRVVNDVRALAFCVRCFTLPTQEAKTKRPAIPESGETQGAGRGKVFNFQSGDVAELVDALA